MGRRGSGARAAGCWSSRRRLVIEKGDGEERLVGGIFRRQRLRRIRSGERAGGGVVERGDRTGSDDVEVADRAVLVDVERDDDVSLVGHRRVRDEPVALHLRDEAADPRTELDAFGVELNLGTELPAAAALVLERLALRVAREIAQRIAERSAGGRRSPARAAVRWPRRRILQR